MNRSDIMFTLTGTNSFHIKFCVICLKMLSVDGGGDVAVYRNLFFML